MRLVGFSFPDLGGTHDYFMCLQKHAKVVLEWLNGGDVQIEDPNKPKSFDDLARYSDRPHWENSRWFMRDDRNSRIKPRKVKRWIAYNDKNKQLGAQTFGKEDMARSVYLEADQFIEIGIEIRQGV